MRSDALTVVSVNKLTEESLSVNHHPLSPDLDLMMNDQQKPEEKIMCTSQQFIHILHDLQQSLSQQRTGDGQLSEKMDTETTQSSPQSHTYRTEIMEFLI